MLRVFALLLLISWPGGIFADEFTSSSYRMEDPVLVPASYATSSGFQLWSTLAQIAVGTSAASSYSTIAGFLAYPFVSTPAVSSTAGDAQVALSWTASEGFLGWTVSGYSVGQSTVSGGPYSYAALGNVTSSTRTGLTNGATYYFVIVAKDSFGNFIATSTQVSATPAAAGSSGGGGGGGGGGGAPVSTNSGATVYFTGRAYPRSTLTLLKDAQVAATTVAGADARFSITLTGLSGGNYIFSMYGEDKDGNRSSLLSFPVSVTAGVNTNVGGIFIAPTIATDKSEVKKGDNIAIFGQSSPQSAIVISVNSEEEIFVQAQSDADGVYLLNFDTSPLEMGSHTAKSKASISGEISSFGKVAPFIVGTKNVGAVATTKCPAKADVNSDCRVNLVDFSIASYWYMRTITGTFIAVEKAKLSGDGKIDLKDLSIMAFYWTG